MNDLHQLAELYGVQTEYRDIWGKQHPLTEETERLLLTAMGVPVDSEQLSDALAEARVRPWQRTLPPVLVLRQGDSMDVPLVVGEDDRGPLRWRCTEEDGALHEGEVPLEDLQISARREVGGDRRVRRTLPLFQPLSAGYHRLALLDEDGQEQAGMSIIVSPGRCFSPEALDGGRVWGPAVQLYGVRSRRNWGMGDFTDLQALCEACPKLGASLVGLNPMHALFPHNPPHASPYCPSSRLALNVMYLDVEAVDDLEQCPEAQDLVRGDDFQARLRQLRRSEQVDYGGVAAAKRPVLEALYASFRARHLEPGSPRAEAFRAFVREGGEALRLVNAAGAVVVQLTFDDSWYDEAVEGSRAKPRRLAASGRPRGRSSGDVEGVDLLRTAGVLEGWQVDMAGIDDVQTYEDEDMKRSRTDPKRR